MYSSEYNDYIDGGTVILLHQVVCCSLSMQGACANVCMSAVYNQLYVCAHTLCSWSDALLHIILSMKSCDVHYSYMMYMRVCVCIFTGQKHLLEITGNIWLYG